ncbi:hypothetical protein [Dankookia sp. P2]|uniref:hypothetical protein n=1 Tax=Dankookia sp. P2 TaxID=3423955 RepID=UPI003D6704D7
MTLQVTVPPEAPPGNYHFNVQVVSTEDTDNDVAQSPAVSFTVPQRAVPVVPPKTAFPWWAVAAGVAFLLVAGGGPGGPSRATIRSRCPRSSARSSPRR